VPPIRCVRSQESSTPTYLSHRLPRLFGWPGHRHDDAACAGRFHGRVQIEPRPTDGPFHRCGHGRVKNAYKKHSRIAHAHLRYLGQSRQGSVRLHLNVWQSMTEARCQRGSSFAQCLPAESVTYCEALGRRVKPAATYREQRRHVKKQLSMFAERAENGIVTHCREALDELRRSGCLISCAEEYRSSSSCSLCRVRGRRQRHPRCRPSISSPRGLQLSSSCPELGSHSSDATSERKSTFARAAPAALPA
jgi:hypothetical protein